MDHCSLFDNRTRRHFRVLQRVMEVESRVYFELYSISVEGTKYVCTAYLTHEAHCEKNFHISIRPGIALDDFILYIPSFPAGTVALL